MNKQDAKTIQKRKGVSQLLFTGLNPSIKKKSIFSISWNDDYI